MNTTALTFVTELSSVGVISLTGEQRHEYLQGQVTIDVHRISESIARLGCHCDFKGKTWSTFLATEHNNSFLLTSDKSALDKSLAELKKYGVFSKVTIVDENESLFCFGSAGKETINALNILFETLPNEHLHSVNNEYGVAVCISPVHHAYQLILNSQGKTKLLANISNGLLKDQSYWELLSIQMGVPMIREATSNEFVPQMLNMQALAAIDFDKGCYMGQETVARTKFLGKNKRATYILKSNNTLADSVIQAGTVLEKQAGENWRSGGTIIRGVNFTHHQHPEASATWLLAVLANDTQVGDMLRLKQAPEQHFEVQALPYALDEK